MELEARNVDPDRITDSRLLKEVRVPVQNGDNPSRFRPAPWWIREAESGSGFRLLWNPRGEDPRTSVAAVIPRDSDRPDWWITLALESRRSTMTPWETARALCSFRNRGWDVSKITDRVAPLLDLPESQTWVEVYLDFTDLPDAVTRRLHRGDVGPRMLRYLMEAPGSVRAPLFDAVGDGRVDWTVQQGRVLAEALRRLSDEERTAWVDHLRTVSGENPRERGAALLDEARRRAYPETTRREDAFRGSLRDLDLDGRIDVVPPDNFEGDYLDFRIRCRRSDDLTELAEELKTCQPLLEHV